MTRSEFVQEIFLQLYPLFFDELLEYDEALGQNKNTISDIYPQAFEKAAEAADIAATSLEIAKISEEPFWIKSE